MFRNLSGFFSVVHLVGVIVQGISYDCLYFCGIGSNVSCFISDFLSLFPFFLLTKGLSLLLLLKK